MRIYVSVFSTHSDMLTRKLKVLLLPLSQYIYVYVYRVYMYSTYTGILCISVYYISVAATIN